MFTRKHVVALVMALVFAAGGSHWFGALQAQNQAQAPAVGSWWGIARPCTTSSRFPTPANTVNQSICKEACLGAACPASQFPLDEVVMAPTLMPDGIVIATDHATLYDGHTTSQGRWENTGKVVIDGKTYDRYQATFMWFNGRDPKDINPQYPPSAFAGMIRPRFVMFFDPTNPDVMQGFIQPYVFNMTDSSGITQLQPGTPWPAADPIMPLPVRCDPTVLSNPYCPGTLMFNIRRIPSR